MQKKELERVIQLNNEMRTMNELLFEQQRKEMESLLRVKHEFKRHLMCIFDYLTSKKAIEASDYCQKVLGEVQREEQGLLLLNFCNFAVSNIYARFIKNCKDFDIPFTSDIEFMDFSFINDMDSSVLFNNLFDNALEACKVASPNCWIDFQIHYLHGNIVMKLTNSVGHEIKLSGQHLLSYKRMYRSPGVGIPQMLSVAEKYDGYVSCDFNSEQFETIIRLPLSLNAT